MNAKEYKCIHEQLMSKWEQECRQWLREENQKCRESKYNINATFFKDGVIDPDTWFDEKNTFRPLFVLKEVNDQNPTGDASFDFVAMDESDGHDIWNGVGHWKDFATLVYAILHYAKDEKELPPYKELRDELFERKSKDFQEVLKHVAVINIKKLGAGGNVNSQKSKKTVVFTEHANQFRNYLKEQISDLIKPDIIIFLGKDIDSCFNIKGNELYGIPTVNGLHPSRNPNRWRKFYYNVTLEKIRAILKAE